MPDLNRVILIGRLVADPALRYTQSGKAVARMTLAVDRRRGSSGERETDFIDVVVWQKLAELCANHLGKGRTICVEGRLQIRNYEAQDGSKRKAAEVVAENVQFLDWPKDGTAGSQPRYSNESEDDLAGLDINDDVPF